MPPASSYSADRRLDIIVFGPMGDAAGSSTVQIQEALNGLLSEPDLAALLQQHRVLQHQVHVPDGQTEQEIVENLLNLLDTADLAVFDLTPKSANADRANVFYELGLVHALGIPAMLLVQKDSSIPFYARTSNQYRVPDFQPKTLASVLRTPLREFLDLDHRTTTFTNDRVSKFYGLPIVDISAAVGLATGYYDNFLYRLIKEGGFLAHHPNKIRHILYVRPSSVSSTYERDRQLLMDRLSQEGLVLCTGETLDLIADDEKGRIWFDHVKGIVLDIPRTIYPLQRSPRLLSLLDRNRSFPSRGAERKFRQRMTQVEESLLDRVEAAIRYQRDHDGSRVRGRILHFTTIDEAPTLVRSLL